VLSLSSGEEIRNRDLQDLPLFRLGDGPLQGPYFGYFEAHIEQGRRLERGNVDVAAVTGIVGLRQCRVVFSGESNHAGSTQMMDRRDAFQGAIEFAYSLNKSMKHKYGAVGGRVLRCHNNMLLNLYRWVPSTIEAYIAY